MKTSRYKSRVKTSMTQNGRIQTGFARPDRPNRVMAMVNATWRPVMGIVVVATTARFRKKQMEKPCIVFPCMTG